MPKPPPPQPPIPSRRRRLDHQARPAKVVLARPHFRQHGTKKR